MKARPVRRWLPAARRTSRAGAGRSTSVPRSGPPFCQVEHGGVVLSGQAVARLDDDAEWVREAGGFWYTPPGPDSWVVGDEPYVSLHLTGGETYAAPSG